MNEEDKEVLNVTGITTGTPVDRGISNPSTLINLGTNLLTASETCCHGRPIRKQS
jgi:hypothetical protein